MIDICIVNAFGFGQEVAAWIEAMPGFGTAFRIKGFLDNRMSPAGKYPVLGDFQGFRAKLNEQVVVALSDPEQKQIVAARLRENTPDLRFFNVIHPENVLLSMPESAMGLIVAPYNSISVGVELGDFTTLYGFCKIGHDVKIGSYCHIASHCSIDGFARIKSGSALPSFTKLGKNEEI